MSTLILTFPATKTLAKLVAKQIKTPCEEIQVKDFPDEESYVKFKTSPKNKTVVIFNSFSRDQNNRLIETILAAGIAKDFGAKKIILAAPYFPYLRQDTHFENFDSFSIKYISPLLKNFDKILIIDPHLQRIKNIKQIGKNFEKLSANNLIAEYIKKNFKEPFTIVGPDKESRQWAQRIANLLGKQATILKKTRFTWEKVKIQSKPLGKNTIIIDDIIGTGNTILETIKVAKHHGAEKVTVIGVHGVLVGDAAKRIRKHASLITTNAIENKFSRIDVSGVIAEALGILSN
ncbi:MAG: ribose-phosphate diphosphokinase [Nanoarchaeota archaeon]|nr:ribose-phosphate diphosphokinase [Nanoarchaeota archaeon]MBU1103974.1 ribose-phosphate diphosphokinase [Nanoarchaeota archaeon]